MSPDHNAAPTDFEFMIGGSHVTNRLLGARLIGTSFPRKVLERHDDVVQNRRDFRDAPVRARALRSFDPVSRRWAIRWLGRCAPRQLNFLMMGGFADGISESFAHDTPGRLSDPSALPLASELSRKPALGAGVLAGSWGDVRDQLDDGVRAGWRVTPKQVPPTLVGSRLPPCELRNWLWSQIRLATRHMHQAQKCTRTHSWADYSAQRREWRFAIATVLMFL